MRPHHCAMTTLLLTGLAISACSSPASPAAPAAPAASPAAAAPSTTTAACAPLVTFDSVTNSYPGGDPTSPPPSSAQLKTWGASAVGPVSALAAAVPADLASAVATLRTAIATTQNGTALNTDDPVLNQASATLDKWGRDTCGFTTLDVAGSGSALSGVPATLPAGPLSFSFTNGGSTTRGFVLLIAKVKNGATFTLDAIKNGSVDFTSVADVVGSAQPTAQLPTIYSTMTLSAGKYLVVSPAGSPPNFTAIQAGEFTVS